MTVEEECLLSIWSAARNYYLRSAERRCIFEFAYWAHVIREAHALLIRRGEMVQ